MRLCHAPGWFLALCLFFVPPKQGAAEELVRPDSYTQFNKNYIKLAIIVWKDDISEGLQGNCEEYANSLYHPPAGNAPTLSVTERPEHVTNITIGWETCTMAFESMWYRAAQLMVDPSVNQRSPADSSSERSNSVLANQLRDVLCGPIIGLPYSSNPFSGVSASQYIYGSIENGELRKDITLGIDSTFPLPSTSIYPINVDALSSFSITGLNAAGYTYFNQPDDQVPASCFNVSYGPRKKLFQVLVWDGPSQSGKGNEDLYRITGTAPRSNCACSTDCGATELYPRICAGVEVGKDVITGARINGTDLCNVKTEAGICYSQTDCQVDPRPDPSLGITVQVGRICAQQFHETRDRGYEPDPTKNPPKGRCFPCPNSPGGSPFECYSNTLQIAQTYPDDSSVTANSFCPDQIKASDPLTSLGSDYAPAWCPNSRYCTGMYPFSQNNRLNICFNTNTAGTTTGLSANGALYHCVSPSFKPYLPSLWHWDTGVFQQKTEDSSIISNTAFSGTSQYTDEKDSTGIFLYSGSSPVCPNTLALFNLLDYNDMGWEQGGNMDVFYPCFQLGGSDFNSSDLQHGNCADKKTSPETTTWPLYRLFTEISTKADDNIKRNAARHALEQDRGLLYNNHLPYNRAQCSANHDKFYIFLGTHSTPGLNRMDVIQTDGYDLITDDMCLWWTGTNPVNSTLSKLETGGESYYYPDRATGSYFNDDQMKLMLYVFNDYVIKNSNSTGSFNANFMNTPYGKIMNNFHLEKMTTCIKPLCRMTNLRATPVVPTNTPNETEYTQEVDRYEIVKALNETQCNNATDAEWYTDFLPSPQCIPLRMSIGLRLQLSLQCMYEGLVQSIGSDGIIETPPATVVPISSTPSGLSSSHTYSYYGKTYALADYWNDTAQQIGAVYSDIQDIMLHIIPDGSQPTSPLPAKINHTKMAAGVCEYYEELENAESRYYYIDTAEDIIRGSIEQSESGLYVAEYSATDPKVQSEYPGAAASLVFYNSPEDTYANPPQVHFRSNNMIRDLEDISPMIMPQVQASLPTATFFTTPDCTSASASESYDFAYMCAQMHYNHSLGDAVILESERTVKTVCDYMYANIKGNPSPASSFFTNNIESSDPFVFNNPGSSSDYSGNYISHQLLDSLIVADAVNEEAVASLASNNGCHTITDNKTAIKSFRLWVKGASTYADPMRDRSAEGWSACMAYLERSASQYDSSFLDTLPPQPQSPYIQIPDIAISEGVCVPCPAFNASDPLAQTTGVGCGAGNLGYCASAYNCEENLFCADVIDSGSPSAGPLVPGVCSNEANCQDRDPVLGTSKKTADGELGFCAAQSQLAVLYFYGPPLSGPQAAPVCIGPEALQEPSDNLRVVGPTTNKPYAKLVLPYDCANEDRVRTVYGLFEDKIFSAPLADGSTLPPKGTFLQFYQKLCMEPFSTDDSEDEIKSILTQSSSSGSSGTPKSLPEILKDHIATMTNVASSYTRFGDRNGDEIYTGWCLNILGAGGSSNFQQYIGGIQFVPGNQFRVAFQPGVPDGAFETPQPETWPLNSSSFKPTALYALPTPTKPGQSYWLSYRDKVDKDFWDSVQTKIPNIFNYIFQSRRTFAPSDVSDIGLALPTDPTDSYDKSNLIAAAIEEVAPIAGCATPRPTYLELDLDMIKTVMQEIGNGNNGDPQVAEFVNYITTFFSSSYDDVIVALNNTANGISHRGLFTKTTGTYSLNTPGFNAYEMNKEKRQTTDCKGCKIVTPPPLTLMFPEFCYWTNADEYNGNFTEASKEQLNMLSRITGLQSFGDLGPQAAGGPNPFQTNAISAMCRPLWEDNFEADVFWKATMLMDSNIDLYTQKFTSDFTAFGLPNSTAPERYERNWYLDLENPIAIPTGGLQSTYFMGAIADMLGDYVGVFAPCQHKFLGPTQESISNSQTQEGILNNPEFAVSTTNQEPNLNVMCLTKVGSGNEIAASVFGGQISIYASYEVDYSEGSGAPGSIVTQNNVLFNEADYRGGFSCKKADEDMPSLFPNGGYALSFPGNCFCTDEENTNSVPGCVGFSPAPGTGCSAVPYPTLPPTPPPPTSPPTTAPPTAKPTTLGQLIEQEDEKTEREIGILAAAFFGAVFVLTLLVAVLAFVLKSTKGSTEVELNVAYVEQFYQEKERQKNLLRRFKPLRFNARRRNNNSKISSAIAGSARAPLKF